MQGECYMQEYYQKINASNLTLSYSLDTYMFDYFLTNSFQIAPIVRR